MPFQRPSPGLSLRSRQAASKSWAVRYVPERAGVPQRWTPTTRAEEHLLPLMLAAGAATDDTGAKVFSDRVMETTLSAFRFG